MANIRINSKNNTIQVRNHPVKAQLRHVGRKGSTGDTGPQGPVGPQGPKGDTGESTFVRVHHGSNPNVPRPDAVYVEWVGSVAPLNATTEDTWIDTA